jgi:hypothetical protein
MSSRCFCHSTPDAASPSIVVVEVRDHVPARHTIGAMLAGSAVGSESGP